MRRRWPPETFAPCSPTVVARPSGSDSSHGPSPTRARARSSSAGVAPGRASARFSASVPANRCASCAPRQTAARRSSCGRVADGDAPERDVSGDGIAEAHQQLGERRLAAAAWAQQRDGTSRDEAQVGAVEQPWAARRRSESARRAARGRRRPAGRRARRDRPRPAGAWSTSSMRTRGARRRRRSWRRPCPAGAPPRRPPARAGSPPPAEPRPARRRVRPVSRPARRGCGQARHRGGQAPGEAAGQRVAALYARQAGALAVGPLGSSRARGRPWRSRRRRPRPRRWSRSARRDRRPAGAPRRAPRPGSRAARRGRR